jgi:hypothetical protein
MRERHVGQRLLSWSWSYFSVAIATTSREHCAAPSFFSLPFACRAARHALRKHALRHVTWCGAKSQLGCLSKAVSEPAWQLAHAHATTELAVRPKGGPRTTSFLAR